MFKSKAITPVKPNEPSQLWTFENALSLLRSCEDEYILKSLDEFLLNNKEVLLNPLPFKGSDDKSQSADKPLKDLSLRNVLYTGISPSNNADAHKISSLIGLDFKEALRTISQTCKRIPEKKPLEVSKLKSKLPDDRERHQEEEKILLYTSRILRDRRAILEIVIELLSNKLNPSKSLIIRNLGKELFLSQNYMETVISTLKDLANLLVDLKDRSSSQQENKFDSVIYNETVLAITLLLKIAIEIFSSTSSTANEVSPKLVNTWFEFMSQNNFMLSLGPYINYTEPFKLIQALSTIVSILLLDMDNNYGDSSFMKDAGTFQQVNSTILQSNNINSIVIYVWSIILYRKMVAEENQSGNNDLIKSINLLNQRSSTLDVFKDLSSINELLSFDNIYSAILSKVIILAIPLITMTNKIASTVHDILSSAPLSIIETFFQDQSVIEAIIIARAKFPIQITPYLKLSSISGNFAINEFSNLRSIMSNFNKQQFDAITEIDDENTDLLKITKNIDIYPPYETSSSSKKLSLLLDSNTKAKVLPSANADEVLVAFLYKYNGWAFLGRILQNIAKSNNIGNEDESERSEFIIDFVQLLNNVVKDNIEEEVAVLDVLDALSAYIDDSDVIEIIFRLFEQNLHSRNVPILISIMNLLTSLVPLIGVKIWTYLGKSALLSTYGNKEGFASTIIGAVEMIEGNYDFTISLVRLVSSLVDDCLTASTTILDKNKGVLLSKFVDHLIQIFESFSHFRFNKPFQKMEIGYLIIEVFESILENVYSIDESEKPAAKVTKVFASSSTKILKSFSSTVSSRSAFPLISVIDLISDHQYFILYETRDLSGYWFNKWVKSSLKFSSLLLEISPKEEALSSFERGLLNKLPLLVEIYSLHQSLRKEVLNLLSSLTNSAAATSSSSSVPSFLSHLGKDHSQMLLSSLISDLENTFDGYDMKISIYDLICAVLNVNQEGLGMLFISGRDVYGEKTNANVTDAPVKSILSVLKKDFQNIKYYPTAVSLHLVDAISLAYNSWTTLRGKDENDDVEFVNLLLSKFSQPQEIKAHTADEYVSRCYEFRVLSKITEILSLIIFTTRNETLNSKFVDFFIKNEDFKFEFLKRFDTIGYNQSLHEELETKFHTLFHMDVSKFSSSLVRGNRIGDDTVYDVELMDKIFSKSIEFGDIWPSIKELVKACNVNIQYSNSQIAVVKSHGALLTAFCKKFGSKVSSDWVFLASQLLFFNVLVDIPTDIFNQVYRERIELSFYILYTMSVNQKSIGEVSNKPIPDSVLDVLKFSCELISSRGFDFANNLSGKSHEDRHSNGGFKTLLRIISISLGMLKNEPEIVVANFNVFEKLFDLVISNGTKSLVIELQNDAYLIRTDKKYIATNLDEKFENLSLVLSIIKEFVNLKDIPVSLAIEMNSILKKNGSIKSLMNLYSTSCLIKVNDELIFSQLSLMVIQELMSINIIAQEFIDNGLLLILTGSPTSLPILQGSLSVKNSPSNYSIWCNGLLPLILVSFKNLGPQILPVVCMFLKSFHKQIETCIGRWSKDSSSIEITTASISETRQIFYLYNLLKMANVDEYLKPFNAKRNVIDIDYVDMGLLPGIESKSKREEFVDNLSNLLKHPKFLSSRVLASSPDEQRILDGSGYSDFFKDVIEDIRELKDFFNEDE